MNRSECTNLSSCQLDIIERDESSATDNTRVICSLAAKGSHPHWNHLNEHIDDDTSDETQDFFARITVDNKLIEVPLNPSKLKQIAQSDTLSVPDSLPANAIFVHYDDGYTRCMPSLYSLLIKRNVIEECPEIEETGEVFSDSAFDVLGTSIDEEIIDQKQRDSDAATKNTDVVYDDKVFDLLGGESPGKHKGDGVSEFQDHNSELPNVNERQAEESKSSNISQEETGHIQLTAAPTFQRKLPDPPSLTNETDEVTRMQKEVAELRYQLQQEQDLMKRDEMMVYQVSSLHCVTCKKTTVLITIGRKEAENLKSVIDQIKELRRETSEILEQTGIER